MRVALPGDALRRRARNRRRIAIGVSMLAVGIAAAGFDATRERARALVAPPRAPTLEIGIRFEDLHPIHQQRRDALETGRLQVSDADLAPATLDIGGETLEAKLRLADGPLQSLTGEKWPLRLLVAKRGHLYGQRSLTLTPPTVGSVVDALFLDHLERHGVLSARLLFVDAKFNGRRLGSMELAEVPSTELLERQQRRDGVVVRVAPDGRVVALEPLRIARSRKLRSDLERAVALVGAALAGTRAADQIFDAGPTGQFLASAERWDMRSSLLWSQLRFYLNPLTARLEPVGVPVAGASVGDAGVVAPIRTPFARQLLANPAIRAAFESAQRRLDAEFADGTAWRRAADRERELRNLIEREDPQPVVAELAARPRVELPEFAGEPRIGADPSDPLPLVGVEETLALHPFLEWVASERELRVRPGTWSVRGSLILPDRVGLRIAGPTVLRFEPRAGLIARGPLHFEGSPDAPIVLEGPPGTREDELWSGVYVVESEQASAWKHVFVRNTGGFERAGWSLPGGVVFRKTHVELEDCEFRTSLAADALNLVRATFRLRDLEVHDAGSDAVDFDYSNGSVERARITLAVGDAIDLGGSRVEVNGALLTDIGDKAISVGERSELLARALDVQRVSIGVASKNSSSAEVRDSEFRQVGLVGLIAYRNRSEYEPGTIYASDNRFGSGVRRALVERGSRIVVDGTETPADDISIASIEAVAATE